MADIPSFFSLKNSINTLTDTDKRQTENYLEVVEAFARTTYQSVYVIDYAQKGFEYVSDNPLFLCGNTAAEVREMGYDFYFKYVPEADLELLLKINTVGFDFYETKPVAERKDYSISYDFHLKTEAGKTLLINQNLTPLFLTESGKIWKAICFVSLSTQQHAGNITITQKGSSEKLIYDLATDCWKAVQKIELTQREQEILHYAMRGYAITEIAEQLYISSNTVKFHRKKLFEKLGVATIYEAISYATGNKLM
ncbi:response regulator transcription factor [Leeuwenhoekiella aestuarii]|uniref:Regulatory LuxR family protein n=1 Tax=Leeuwenhoekiella aestuarii TaxID=2249426 RepID=A0A4V1KPE2_9FLAO|nr:helix-turn-helix transcriptional regulator [Leeuwenhoekiella aestuarii]RXG15243.1 regulatory LuxR family protein [Leeuwenhoekiella aestuarii]